MLLEDASFTQNYSVPKVLGAETLLLIGAILPLTPNFVSSAVQTRYIGFLYVWPFFLLVILSSLYLGFLFLLMIPVLWRALLRLPAIEFSRDEIVVHSNRERRASVSEIVRITPTFGNAMIKLHNGKKFAAPLSLLEQPSTALTHLVAVLPASVAHEMQLSR